MNPISSIVMGVSAITSLLSMGTSAVGQAANLHRQLKPAQAQQMQCPAPKYKLEVLVTADGKRQLVCLEAQ